MKINILGASGSGVTTLGKKLSTDLNIAYFDSDDFFWKKTEIPFTEKKNANIRDREILEKLNKKKNWILGGSVINWSDKIHKQFEIIIFLQIPQKIRLERLEKREQERYGDIIKTGENRKKQFEEFMKWAKDYDEVTGIANRNIIAHKNWLEKQSAKIIKITEDLSTESRINIVMDEIKPCIIKL